MSAIFSDPGAVGAAHRDATRLRRLRTLWGLLPRPRRIRLSLALQGGGAHGAFTWGVLDRLLEEPHIRLDGISGASAGAVNAVVLASGWLHGGREGAREALSRFWLAVARQSEQTQALLGPLWPAPGSTSQYALMRSISRMASPYQFNPTGFNPLEGLLESHVDFEGLRRRSAHRLYIAVTNVHSGELRVLRNHELSPRGLAASTCLPLLFQAVELDGQYYWDGGYSGNPALLPLILEGRAQDLLMVRLCPRWHPDVPTRPAEILERASEFGFNAGFLRELQVITQLQEGVRRFGPVSGMQRRLRRTYLHEIDGHEALTPLGTASRVNTSQAFLTRLMELGRGDADRWLRQFRGRLGRCSTYQLAD